MTPDIPHPATEPMTTTVEEPMQLSRDEIETIRDSLYNGHILDVRTDCFESLCDMALQSLDRSPPAADVQSMIRAIRDHLATPPASEDKRVPLAGYVNPDGSCATTLYGPASEDRAAGPESYAERRKREKLFQAKAYDSMRHRIMQAFRFREPTTYAWDEQISIVERVYKDLLKDVATPALVPGKPTTECWNEWYGNLPSDLTRKLSIHDFKRLGDLFKTAFDVPASVKPPGSP